MKFSLDQMAADLSTDKVAQVIRIAADLVTEAELMSEMTHLMEARGRSETLFSTRQKEALKTIVYFKLALAAVKSHLLIIKSCPPSHFPAELITEYGLILTHIQEAERDNKYRDDFGDSELRSFLIEPEQKILSAIKQTFIDFTLYDFPEKAFADKVTSSKVTWENHNVSLLAAGSTRNSFLQFAEMVLSGVITFGHVTTKSPDECQAYRNSTCLAEIPRAEGTLPPPDIENPMATPVTHGRPASTWFSYFSRIITRPRSEAATNTSTAASFCAIQ